jgi:hypothetical protein
MTWICDHLLGVMQLQRREVGFGKTAASLPASRWMVIAGRKTREPLVEPNHLLLVQPQQGVVEQFFGVMHFGVQADRSAGD